MSGGLRLLGRPVCSSCVFVFVLSLDISFYQFVTSIRMYVMCGVFVGRRIGPVWMLGEYLCSLL